MIYSTDFREKVLNFIESGGKIKEACQLFSISHCSINRWKNNKKIAGSVGHKPRPNLPYKIDNEDVHLKGVWMESSRSKNYRGSLWEALR